MAEKSGRKEVHEMKKNDKMRMPGFSAEASLYQMSQPYQVTGTLVAQVGKHAGRTRVEPMSIDQCTAYSLCCAFTADLRCCTAAAIACFNP